MSMQRNKSPGNDGLTKEFFVAFWEDIKGVFLNSCRTAKLKKELSTSQKQAIIKLIEKKDKDKRFIKNWRPISLLNVDYKIISKALASRVKKVLPNLISPQQTAYVENRFIGESGRLIADIIEITDVINKEGLLVTMDIEKAFDSLDHTFVISVLKKFGFGNNFVSWIETLISKQESCVINGGNTTQYFHLEREARQGDPISAYIFILALEVLSFLVRNNKDIKGLNIFDHLFLYTAYADDTTFFLESKESIEELVKTFTLFSSFSGLKPNISKCEICGLGPLNWVEMAVCGMQSVDLTRDAIKILGVYFSYNINLVNQKNYCQAITNIHGILKLWRMRNLPIEGKIVVFKTLAISKLVYLALLTVIPDHITDEVTKIQKSFIWHDSSPKIKHETLRMEFKAGGLKNVDIRFKFVSFQCSWVKKLYDDCFLEWKIIPLHLLNKCFGPSFKFHSNLHFESKLLKQFPSFYKQILMNWKKYLIASPITPSRVLSQFIWYNSYIKIDSKAVYLNSFSTKNINFVTQLFNTDGSVKNWNILKTEYTLQNKDQFCWLQLINAIPEMWKKCIKQTSENTSFLVVKDHHLFRGSRIIILEKLNSIHRIIFIADFCNRASADFTETF